MAFLLVLLSAIALLRPALGVDPSIAEQYFKEAKTIADKDGGRLWGRRLGGPMIFVDRGTRSAVANQADGEGRLSRAGSLFVGTLPPGVPIANTGVDWAGVRWTMVAWPLPADRLDRAGLIGHEMFHRIQPDLGLSMPESPCSHLDTLEGRYWLRLEWRALHRAMTAPGNAWKAAARDALLFRARRRSIFPESAAPERAQETNEGLAEYTGLRLRGTSATVTRMFVATKLDGAASLPTFVRSFAYQTGPAYGLLLDMSKPAWRRGIRPTDDLGEKLINAMKLALPSNLGSESDTRADSYGAKEIRAAEEARDRAQKKRLAQYPA